MSGPGVDPVDWLLPDAGDSERARARRVTTFLRLLADDARGAKGNEVVGCGLERARVEMERATRADALRVLTALLQHGFAAAASEDTFADAGTPARCLRETWAAVERMRAAGVAMPDVPLPGEPVAHMLERVLDVAAKHGAASVSLTIWKAHRRQLETGPRAAEAAWREAHEEVRRQGERGTAADVATVRGIAACMLDRGAVGRARDWLDHNLATVSCDDALVWLSVWTHLLAGQEQEAEALVRGLEPYAGRLPRPLVELRAARPDWRRLLPGCAPAASRTVPGEPVALPFGRREVGASVLALFELRDGSREVLAIDQAPALSLRRDAWLRARERAHLAPGEPEHRLRVDAQPLVFHREGEPLRAALEPRTARALALVPWLDEEGEVAGWLHVECEHGLLPSTARLVRLARAWRDRHREPRSGSGTTVAERAPTRSDTSAGPAMAADDPRAALVHAWVRDLPLKTTRRRWWFFEGDASDPRLVAEGGGGLCDWREAPGQAWAIRRAFATSGTVVFDRSEVRMARAARSGCGFATPVILRGQVVGVFALEAARRGDFAPGRIEALAQAAVDVAPAYRAAQFRAWHAREFGHDVCVGDFVGTGERALDIHAIGTVGAPVLIVGESGSGKRVVARQVHYASDPRATAASLVTLRAVELSARALRDQLEGAVRATSVLLEGIDGLSDEGAREVMRWLSHHDRGGPRFFALARRSLSSGPAGSHMSDLARRLARLELRVPPLRERRNEIPALAVHFARRFAGEEGLLPLTLDDTALASLWRQPWPGNLAELEAFVYRVAVHRPGATLGATEIGALAEGWGQPLLRRLRSRRPSRPDVAAALALTRTRRGSLNKTRAALYLGWDPATLALRLAGLGLKE